LIPVLFQRVEFATNQVWQASGRDLIIQVANEVNNPQLRYKLYGRFDLEDVERCFLGVMSEYDEWTETTTDEHAFDEFCDIIFYLARVWSYIDFNYGGLDFKYYGLPMHHVPHYYIKLCQPFRNMYRPDGIKEKHLDILKYNLKRLAGTIMAHAQFKGYTDDMIVNHLIKKLTARYSK
jgi:hypothetical protein